MSRHSARLSHTRQSAASSRHARNGGSFIIRPALEPSESERAFSAWHPLPGCARGANVRSLE
jgi:hypothetical protein